LPLLNGSPYTKNDNGDEYYDGCLAYFIRYYYDTGTKSCKEFIWGGEYSIE
jgi:hypothetical protein